MENYVTKNILYFITILGIIVAVFTFLYQNDTTTLQKLVNIFFIGLILHLWEESKSVLH